LARPKKGFEKPKWPPVLARRSSWMEQVSTATTAKERVKLLLRDEEKYYSVFYKFLDKLKIPPLPNFQLRTDLELSDEMLKLTKLKQMTETYSSKCLLHVAFLTNKVGDLKHVAGIEGLHITEVSSLMSRMRDYLVLFKYLSKVFADRLDSITENIKIVKSMIGKLDRR
jgi:D-hexose-6-phosphate mutarotase